MNKHALSVFFLLISINQVTYCTHPHKEPKTIYVKMSENSHAHKPKPEGKVLYTTVLVGAVISLVLWLPEAEKAINKFGVLGAVATTHIPRVGLDILTIAAMIKALMHEDRVIVIEKNNNR